MIDRISRREVVWGAAATTAALHAPSVRAHKDQQTLRFVAQADLKILDPVWTTAYITRNHAYLVYDTLFGTDEELRVKPQMVERFTVSPDGMKYTFTLRDGLQWHDGQAVLAEDCVESLKRWGKIYRFGQFLLVEHYRCSTAPGGDEGIVAFVSPPPQPTARRTTGIHWGLFRKESPPNLVNRQKAAPPSQRGVRQ